MQYGDTTELLSILEGSIEKNHLYSFQDFLEENGLALPKGTYLEKIINHSKFGDELNTYEFGCRTAHEETDKYLAVNLDIEVTARYFTASSAIGTNTLWLNEHVDDLRIAANTIAAFRLYNLTRMTTASIHTHYSTIPWQYCPDLERCYISSALIDYANMCPSNIPESVNEIQFYHTYIPVKDSPNGSYDPLESRPERIVNILAPAFFLAHRTFDTLIFSRKSH